MQRSSLALLTAAAVLTALPAAAQFKKSEDAIEYRQAVMEVMGHHVGNVAAMAQGKAPFDAKAAANDIAIAAMMSHLPYIAFGPGTDKGHPTRAKPLIWTDQAKFKKLAEDMQAEMAKLEAAGQTGDLDQIKTAVGDTSKACKACHDDFRADKFLK